MTIEAKLVDVMGNDTSVVNAARVSYGVVREGELNERDVRLVKFLAREHHVTPFRHATITFRCKAPIAIARQLGKHQVGFSWNEMSRRYKDGGVEVFKPEVLFKRPEDLHDGSGDAFNMATPEGTMAYVVFDRMCEEAVANYERLLGMGVAPEQARFILPQGMITEWVWTGSLYGWFEVYRQRSSSHAQYEVRLFAQEIDKVLSELFPVAWESLKATIKDTE